MLDYEDSYIHWGSMHALRDYVNAPRPVIRHVSVAIGTGLRVRMGKAFASKHGCNVH